MMQQYMSIKEQYPDTLVLFRLGDFYELFGEDAKIAAKVLEITLTSRDRGDKEDRMPMCGVPHHAISGYLEKLIKNGYKVSIVEQLEDPKTAKGVVKRDVVRVVTPGTFLEGNVEDNRNVFLVGLNVVNNIFGVAVVDLSTGKFQVTEIDNEQGLVDELQRIGPAEIVVPEHKSHQLETIIGQFNTLITKTPKRNWVTETCQHLLQNHFHIQTLTTLGIDSDMLTQVAGGVLTYLQGTQQAALEHITHIERYFLANSLQIDAVSQRNLELTKTIRDEKKHGSLFGVLDQTVTSMGGRLLRLWIEKPLLEIDGIKERQSWVSSLLSNSLLRTELENHLDAILDLERLLSRLVYGSGNARDLIALKDSLKLIPNVKNVLADETNSLYTLAHQLDPVEQLVSLIEQGVVEEPPITIRDGGLIKPEYNEELDELRLTNSDGKSWIATMESKERERTGIKSLKVGYNRVFGYYIEVTKSNLDHVPDDYTRKQTLTNAERFITPELKEKEALILGAQERITELEYELFIEIRDAVKQYIVPIQENSQILAILDVVQALAKVALDNNYICPEINDTTEIEIVDGRHPVIDALQNDFVPNDLVFTDQKQIVLLTGPNMAGKSTYLRQAALIVILAQLGSYVPATSARIGIVDRIFTRIGAADDLSTGQSTFMVECSETANLVRNATSRSLIILDELGRGTSTFDGMAIAQSVMEYIHDHVHARTLFSTHYHELTRLENALKQLSTFQMAVKESQGQVFFLHKVVEGNADRSYGINVAKMAGMPQPIISRAQILLYQFEADQKKPLQLDLLHSMQYPEIAVSELDRDLEVGFTPQNDPMIEKFKDNLASIDINELTPLAALNLVAKLQKLANEGDDHE